MVSSHSQDEYLRDLEFDHAKESDRVREWRELAKLALRELMETKSKQIKAGEAD